MADLTITATSVVKSTNAAITRQYFAGETITAGQLVYVKTVGTTSTLFKAKCAGTVTEAGILGVALNGGAVGQAIAVQTAGIITIGATVVVGGLYISSSTYGGIAPFADIATTNYVTILGVADTATTITLGISATGIAHA